MSNPLQCSTFNHRRTTGLCSYTYIANAVCVKCTIHVLLIKYAWPKYMNSMLLGSHAIIGRNWYVIVVEHILLPTKRLQTLTHFMPIQLNSLINKRPMYIMVGVAVNVGKTNCWYSHFRWLSTPTVSGFGLFFKVTSVDNSHSCVMTNPTSDWYQRLKFNRNVYSPSIINSYVRGESQVKTTLVQ